MEDTLDGHRRESVRNGSLRRLKESAAALVGAFRSFRLRRSSHGRPSDLEPRYHARSLRGGGPRRRGFHYSNGPHVGSNPRQPPEGGRPRRSVTEPGSDETSPASNLAALFTAPSNRPPHGQALSSGAPLDQALSDQRHLHSTGQNDPRITDQSPQKTENAGQAAAETPAKNSGVLEKNRRVTEMNTHRTSPVDGGGQKVIVQEIQLHPSMLDSARATSSQAPQSLGRKLYAAVAAPLPPAKRKSPKKKMASTGVISRTPEYMKTVPIPSSSSVANSEPAGEKRIQINIPQARSTGVETHVPASDVQTAISADQNQFLVKGKHGARASKEPSIRLGSAVESPSMRDPELMNLPSPTERPSYVDLPASGVATLRSLDLRGRKLTLGCTQQTDEQTLSNDNGIRSLGEEKRADSSIHSDFPSLSGGQQQTSSNSNPAVWGSSNARNTLPNAPVQRPPGAGQQANTQASGPSFGQPQHSVDTENARSSLFPSSHTGADDLRFDDQSAGSRDPRRLGQQGATDEFPPLGGLGRNDIRQSNGQPSQLAGLGSGAAYSSGQLPNRNGAFSNEAMLDGLAPPSATSRMMSPSDMPSNSASFMCLWDPLIVTY